MRLHPGMPCDVNAARACIAGRGHCALTMQQDLIARYMRTLQIGYELFRASMILSLSMAEHFIPGD